MRNIIALFAALITFTAAVAVTNAQGAQPDSAFNFDIRDAVENLAAMLAPAIGDSLSATGFSIPYAGIMAIAGIALSLPSLFVFVLLARSGR
ncbi:MAG: hypothetical protein GC150_08465 [Rhizobiales bacterium]|nr:hypothetical protein [Hyphomicrobiales bacterium]